MDAIIGFIVSSPEYRAWGWNIETLINVTINLLTMITFFGASKQARHIWKERSASGLSGATFPYFFFYCLAFFVYGAEKGALNMVIGSMVGIAYVPIILGIWRFGDTKEKLVTVISSAVFATMPGIMARLEFPGTKEMFLALLLMGMFLFLLVGFDKLCRAPGIDGFNPAFSWAFLAAGVFWIPYSYTLGELGLVLFNVGMVVVMIATLVIYYSRKKKMAARAV